MYVQQMETPTGDFWVASDGTAVIGSGWLRPAGENVPCPVLDQALAQIEEYFAGTRDVFELPLAAEGSAFQQAVWTAIAAIPMGETRRYGDLSKEVGAPARAVGQACGANPIPLIVPCHRVLGSKGLGGFSGAGGVETKVALLRHEGAAGLLI